MKPKRLLYGLSLLLFLVIPSPHLCSQSFNIRQYTTSDGLPGSVVFGVDQDSYGYLWIATNNGLSRFDGKEFVNYGVSAGLPSLSVNGVFEDHLHRLWIFTRNGLAELKGDSCHVYPLNKDEGKIFVGAVTETMPGKLLALTNKRSYVFQNNKWEENKISNGFDDKSLSGIVSCKEGYVLNYENKTVALQKKNNEIKILASHNTESPYFNTIRGKNNTCYISTYKGLFRLENEKLVGLFEDTLRTRYVYGFYVDSKNRFWISTKEDGILLISPGKDKTTYQKIPISFNLVYNFFEDKEKNVWISCLDGLLKISDAPYQTYRIPAFDGLNDIRNIISLPGNQLLVSGSSGKALLLEQKRLPDQSIIIKTVKALNLTPGDFIDYYSFDEKDRLWCCTRESHLYRLENGVLTDFTYLIKIKQGIRSVYYDKFSQKLYVSVDSVLFAGNEKKLDTLKENKAGRYVPLPAYVYRVPGGNLIVNTLNDGLIKIDAEGSFSRINSKAGLPEYLGSGIFRNDNQKKMWLSYSGGGLLQYEYDAKNEMKLLQSINKAKGLPDDAADDFTFDTYGNMWIITKRGLMVMQQNESGQWRWHLFETGNDIRPTDLFFTKITADGEGNLWASTRNRLLRFQSPKNIIPEAAPDIIIEKIQLFNKPTDWGKWTDSSANYFQLPVNPQLKFNKNTLTIFFNGIKYNRNNLLEYSYKLLPADTGWSEPVTSNSVSFYQLKAGHYQFLVKARIKGDEWSQPASFSFSIKKPFWETWWFRAIAVLFFSGILISIFRYRLTQLRKKAALETQIRELEMKALKAQMNPHFIHNALNSIQSLIVNKKSDEASHYISKFARLLRQVLENADKNVISLDKELYSLQLYFDLEKLRMNMPVEYTEEIDESIIASEIKVPPLILQPFIENALWHGLSLKEGDKKLQLTITEEPNWIICTIVDNGIGRKKAAESSTTFPEGHFSKAISITEKRLAGFNQTNQPEPIRFTDLYKDGIPAGTQVAVRIRKQF